MEIKIKASEIEVNDICKIVKYILNKTSRIYCHCFLSFSQIHCTSPRYTKLKNLDSKNL